MINPHVYGWAIDIWPDSFPLGQGMSKEEFLAKGKPVVFHKKREDIVTASFKNEFFVAKDDKEYIELINTIMKDRVFTKKMVQLEQEYQLTFKGKSLVDVLEAKF